MKKFTVLTGMLLCGIGWVAVSNAQEQPAAKADPGATTAVAATPPETPPETPPTPSSGWSFPKCDFVVNVLPASILVNVNSDRFGVTKTTAGKAELSSIYVMPNISAGAGCEIWNLYVDLTAGVGLVVNDSFRTFLVDAILSANYAATDSLKLGPHVGLIYFTSPEWVDGSDVTFKETWGMLAGLQMSMGDRITYLVSVDLIYASFDAQTRSPSVSLDMDQVKMTGLAVQFGVRGEF